MQRWQEASRKRYSCAPNGVITQNSSMARAMETTDTTTLLERLLSTPNYLSESILAQLGLAFLLSSTRSEPRHRSSRRDRTPREDGDKRAMMLYIGALGAGLGARSTSSFYLPPMPPSLKAAHHCVACAEGRTNLPGSEDARHVPSTRPERIEPAQLQAKVAETVEAALRDELRNIAAAPFKQPPRAPAARSRLSGAAVADAPGHRRRGSQSARQRQMGIRCDLL